MKVRLVVWHLHPPISWHWLWPIPMYFSVWFLSIAYAMILPMVWHDFTPHCQASTMGSACAFLPLQKGESNTSRTKSFILMSAGSPSHDWRRCRDVLLTLRVPTRVLGWRWKAICLQFITKQLGATKAHQFPPLTSPLEVVTQVERSCSNISYTGVGPSHGGPHRWLLSCHWWDTSADFRTLAAWHLWHTCTAEEVTLGDNMIFENRWMYK